MIIKFFEIKKINLSRAKLILLYGKNEGLKNQEIKNLIEDNDNVFTYEEKEILNNENEFLEKIMNKSLFEPKKVIVIKRVSDKILNFVKEINEKNLEDITIILNADNLEKKSKLRTLFEKDKQLICVAFYPDNEQTLSKLAYEFLNERKISISPSNINSVIKKSNGDRDNLFNDLRKIENYCKNGKKLNSEIISKLLSLHEDYSISELVDNCLAKNKSKTLYILNENNFSTEDCILITRTFLNKSKRILFLSNNYNENKNMDLTISSAKPPIFWKDKEIIKQQVYKWSPGNIKSLIYKINELELLIKKNATNAINLITNFILEQSSATTNN
ncbi:DNA polymerase III subunit delta [Candidatus Pelagibacter sp.]|nr:DNA polymerase III subunit delta [Candidatus Pelagibacter sp.]